MSLRDEWPALSPRERDARVAEALGLHLWEWCSDPCRPGPRSLSIHDLPVPPSASFRVVPWATFRAEEVNRTLYAYTTSWSLAGPLLDKLREEGWRATLWMNRDGAGVALSRTGAAEAIDTDAQVSGPSAIALAFCLSREAAGA